MTNRPWLLRVSAVVMAVIAAGWMVHAWQVRSYPTLIAEGMIVSGALYAGLRTQIARFVPIAQRWRASPDGHGIILRPNLFRVLTLPSGLLVMLSGLFALGVLQMLGRLAAPTPEHLTSRNQMLLNLVPVVGMVSGVLALVVIGSLLWAFGTAGSKSGALVVAREGVTLWGGPARTLAWDAVRDVQPPPGTDTGLRATDLVISGGSAPLTLPLSEFPRDSSVLPDMVHYYWRHPERRAELGTPQAMARWEARDYRSV